MSVLLNVIVSGASVSGNLDTTANEVRIEMGNADMIGHCSFEVYNSGGQYSTVLLSGNPTLEIDVVRNAIAVPLFKGTVEKAIPQISIQKGSTVQFDGYDLGQELLNVVSPDGRVPYVITGSGINILSGDGGAAALQGLDLVVYTSGPNASGNVSLAQFMSQWFGTSGDHTGSQSGILLSFKPYVSGYSWKTYYVPDASGLVAANDNNKNYFLNLDGMKARHEYAWDALRKVTRQQHAVDSLGNKVAFEMFTDVSGAIHMFASGSYERVASGAVLVYYAAPNSGQANNNIVNAKVPYDLTLLKNYINGWFPSWTHYPYDKDAWSDWLAYSGAYWSGLGKLAGVTTISGDVGAPFVGAISIMANNVGPAAPKNSGMVGLVFTMFSGQVINFNQFNVSGGAGVTFNYLLRWSGDQTSVPYRTIGLFDLSGNFIAKSGATYPIGGGPPVGVNILDPNSTGQWLTFSEVIWANNGTLLSGTGLGFNSGDGTSNTGWTASATFPDLSNIKRVEFGINYSTAASTSGRQTSIWIDSVFQGFSYPFSPISAFNSGSQGIYGRRYAVIEWPDEISPTYASGLMTAEMQARMGSQGIAEFIVHDNFNSNPISAQLGIKPGYIFVVDAPVLGTGSGQVFNLWRASKVTHIYSKSKGFESTIYAYPYYSGVGFSGTQNNNQINYMTPLVYSQVQPNPEREAYLPIGRPWSLGKV